MIILFEKKQKMRNGFACDARCAGAPVSSRAGFTLVELLVAFSIFAILVAVVSGSFVRSLRIQRVALELMAINDNMAITLEQMMREMRTGYNFCTNTSNLSNAAASVQAQCAALQDGEIQFVTSGNVIVRYRLKNNTIQKGVGDAAWDPANPKEVSCSEGEFDASSGICYRAMTADTIKIVSANFLALHNDVENGQLYPPRIVLNFTITSNNPSVESFASPITIQTTVSARCGATSCPSDT